MHKYSLSRVMSVLARRRRENVFTCVRVSVCVLLSYERALFFVFACGAGMGVFLPVHGASYHTTVINFQWESKKETYK